MHLTCISRTLTPRFFNSCEDRNAVPSVLPDGSVFCHAVARAPPAARLWLLFLKACIAPFGEREAGGGAELSLLAAKTFAILLVAFNFLLLWRILQAWCSALSYCLLCLNEKGRRCLCVSVGIGSNSGCLIEGSAIYHISPCAVAYLLSAQI